jgi:hypothetical protein
MSIQIQGNSGVVAEVDGLTYRALRVTVRPVDYGVFGSYRISVITGTMAVALPANSEMFQARWTDATRLALIWGFSIDGMSDFNSAFSAGFSSMTFTIARGWSADGSGGNAATLTGNNQKLRTSMGTPLMAAIRSSSTGALTTGTKTLDAQPEGQITFSTGTVANVIFLGQIQVYGSMEAGSNPAPIILAQNEGVVARATVPAGGTWQTGFTMSWSEVASY